MRASLTSLPIASFLPVEIHHYGSSEKRIFSCEETKALISDLTEALSLSDQTDTVFVQLPNLPEYVALISIAFSSNCSFAFIDNRWPQGLVFGALDDCQPNVIVTDDAKSRFYEKRGYNVSRSVGRINILKSQNRVTNDLANQIVFFSSGSTGRPKAIVHHKSSVLRNAAMHIKSVQIDADDCILCAVPMSYSYGFVSIVCASLLLGSKLVTSESFVFLHDIKEMLIQGKVTVFPSTPFSIKRLLASCPEVFTVSSLCKLLVGGDYLAPRLMQKLVKAMRADVIVTYGLAEAGPRVMTGYVDMHGKYDLVPMEGVEVRLKNELLQVRSPTLMAGYLSFGKLSQSHSVFDGELDTQDLFHQTDQGMYFKGRQKNIISRHGDKINPKVIEQEVAEHPYVLDAQVETEQEAAVDDLTLSIVILDQALTSFSEQKIIQDIKKFCRQRLKSSEIPSAVKIVPHIKSK